MQYTTYIISNSVVGMGGVGGKITGAGFVLTNAVVFRNCLKTAEKGLKKPERACKTAEKGRKSLARLKNNR